MKLKLYVDDIRPTPDGYTGYMTTNAGDCVKEGGDYINILKEMERLAHVKKFDFSHIKFRLHSANPVGVQNMRAIIEKNGWKEIR